MRNALARFIIGGSIVLNASDFDTMR